MLRIVRPVTAALSRSIIDIVSVAAGVDVVSVEIVVVVDGHVAAAVPVTVAPTASPRSAHRDAGSESQQSITRWVRIRIRIRGRSINYCRTVLGNVDHLWIRRLNDNGLFASFHRLGFDRLLCGRFQIPVALRLSPHSLNRIHHVGLLGEKRIAQVRCPRNVLA
jgi:hypothetical protein